MDMNDILHSLYFTIEWGTQIDEKDKTFDTEFTPRAAQSIQTIVAINQIDEDTVEVYVNYWHFNENEIAEWAAIWGPVPWELTAAMEKAVMDGKVSFSRSGATSKSVNWLSLIVPNDAQIIKEYLKEFRDNEFIPNSLKQSQKQQQYFDDRFDSSINWIEKKNHAVISNGPFYLETYSPESRTIQVKAFEDNSYPFEIGTWSKFENMQFPNIKKINMQKIIQQGESTQINIETEGVTSLLYFILDSEGRIQIAEESEINENKLNIKITSDITKKLQAGTNQIKIFGISNSVLKPDIYETNFIVTKEKSEIPKTEVNFQNIENEINYDVWMVGMTVVAIMIGITIFLKKRF
jgi:peptide/nickel transport system substrate-binding protein